MALGLEDGVVAHRSGTAHRTMDSDRALPGRWRRLSLTAGSGVLLALTFPPVGWAWLTPVAAAGLTWACRGQRVREGALAGLAYGLGFFLALLQWVRVIGVDAWLALSLVEASFLAALGAALALVTRLRWWPVWAAALWVGQELLRGSVPLGGFPWGRLAFALDDTPMAALASLGGASFVTFVAALVGNVLLWTLLARGRRLVPRIAALVAATSLAFGGLLVPTPTTGDGTATVAVVQGNVPGRGMDFLGNARTVTRNHLEATEQLMRDVAAGQVPQPDFVVWPENSTDLDPFFDRVTRDVVERAVATAGVPVLVGAVLRGPGPTYRRTTGVVWDPETGPGQIYVKQHPVPFGEYVPFRDVLLPLIERLEVVGKDTYAGSEPGFLQIAGYDVGDIICFEVAYDDIVRGVARLNPELLVVQTNNSTYLGTGQPQQQFAMTRLRAIEFGKTILVASPSGISGIIAPDGTVIAKSHESTREVFVERVQLHTTPTLAARVGRAPEWVLTVVGLAALALGWRRRSRQTQPSHTQSGQTGPTQTGPTQTGAVTGDTAATASHLTPDSRIPSTVDGRGRQ